MDRMDLGEWVDDVCRELDGLEYRNSSMLGRCCREALNGVVELGAYDDPALMKPFRVALYFCPECGSPLELDVRNRGH